PVCDLSGGRVVESGVSESMTLRAGENRCLSDQVVLYGWAIGQRIYGTPWLDVCLGRRVDM
ncbi:hypothetical protein NP568_25225, partial [Vibrio parahaemolyticus]|nr:hypothetical protein [Vibrio parahaemolyticus]